MSLSPEALESYVAGMKLRFANAVRERAEARDAARYFSQYAPVEHWEADKSRWPWLVETLR